MVDQRFLLNRSPACMFSLGVQPVKDLDNSSLRKDKICTNDRILGVCVLAMLFRSCSKLLGQCQMGDIAYFAAIKECWGTKDQRICRVASFQKVTTEEVNVGLLSTKSDDKSDETTKSDE
jgi:hypothetical protein